MAATTIRPTYRTAMNPADLDLRGFAKEVGRYIALMAIALIPTVGRELALGILIVMAFGSPASALKSLAAGTVVTFLNPSIVPGGGESNPIVGGLKWVLLFVACGRSLLTRLEQSKAQTRLIYSWTTLTIALLINSLFISLLPSISIFKTISFSLGILCVIRLAMLTAKQNEEMLVSVAALGTAVFAASIPLLVLGPGRYKNSSAFNGILSQPQALGVLLLMTGAATFAVAFRTSRLQRALFFCAVAQWAMIAPTGSRTPLMAIAIGGLVYLFEIVTRGERIRIGYLLTPLTTIALAGIVTVAALTPTVREGLASYLQKGKEQPFDPSNPELSISESSRGTQVFNTLELAEEHPLFGAGFGVDEGSGFSLGEGAKFYGIPLSAPIEQGFLPIASVAQIGLIGSFFVVILLLVMFGYARHESGETSALFAAILGVNFGEMIFFGFGGLGSLMWVLLALLTAGGTIPPKWMKAPGK